MSRARPLISATGRTAWHKSAASCCHPTTVPAMILPLSTVSTSSSTSSLNSLSFPFGNSIAVFDSLVSEVLKTHINLEIQQPSSDQTRSHSSGSQKTPLVLLFGWEDSSHHSMAKYSEIYREAGCTTVQYILPVKYIFDYTEKVPELMKSFLIKLQDEEEIHKRPVYIHCLSDTGLMCYKGLQIENQRRKSMLDNGESLNINGVVFDSSAEPDVDLRGILKFKSFTENSEAKVEFQYVVHPEQYRETVLRFLRQTEMQNEEVFSQAFAKKPTSSESIPPGD